jgi:peptide subunit release factor 1 (eRF1)
MSTTPRGQVDEPIIAASPAAIKTGERVADELVAKARQTAAKIRFIEDAALLSAVGGVGALLRYTV